MCVKSVSGPYSPALGLDPCLRGYIGGFFNINNLMIHDPMTSEWAVTVTFLYPLILEGTAGAIVEVGLEEGAGVGGAEKRVAPLTT